MSNSLLDVWNKLWDDDAIQIELNPVTLRYVAKGLKSIGMLMQVIGDVSFDASRYMEVLLAVSQRGYCFEDTTEYGEEEVHDSQVAAR
jgi:hypothetical protein